MHIRHSLRSILLVDDIADNIQILNGVLNAEYKILAATSGNKALAIARQHPQPDMILLDVMMPEIDGFEVCRLLKKDPVTKHIPIIFVTGKSEAVDELLGFELGAVDYITKPYNPAIVKTRVKAHFSLSVQNHHLEDLVKMNHDNIITREEMIALNNIFLGEASCRCTLDILQSYVHNNTKISADVASIIQSFSLLNNDDKQQVTHLIETLHIGDEDEKDKISDFFGLDRS
ncbi:response regulator [Moritella sp. Urea-trap-13]|uniref:response regulator n=1 Tax=Moritella sp. Urea-trap-13 TaxID=2058327 RepID=UPI000C33F419|nr:response regulator [Moritella sp. Urea-trap-13]PKH09632.1 response regulator [Moritella sp. Urea-trap-13]